MAIIHILNVTSQIEGLDENQKKILSDKLSFQVPNVTFIQSVKNRHWDGRKRYFNLKYSRFPTGLISKVRDFLNEHNIAYSIVDNRERPVRGDTISNKKPFDWYPYQIDTLNKLIQVQRGIIKLPTGAGKSRIIVGLIGQLNVKTLIVTHRIDIILQLKKDIELWLDTKIGILTGDEKQLLENINIASVQTILGAFKSNKTNILSQQIIDFVKNCECLVVDESHHVSAECYQLLTNRCYKAFYRYGFTATPFHEMGGEFLIEACFAKRIVDINIKELVEQGYLAKPYVLYLEHKYKIMRGDMFNDIYKKGISENEVRNNIICDMALRRVSKNKSVLISVKYIKHGEILLKKISKKYDANKISFIKGEIDSEERQQVLQDLDNKKIMIVIATTVFNEGVNVKSLDTLINAKAQDSVVDFLQTIGRAMRKTNLKNKVLIIDFFDNFRYFRKKSQERLNVIIDEKLRLFYKNLLKK
jgi:superfamily II DNA or RNA helicase